MITVYDSREINFENNGLCVLDNCIRCEVEEELNGFYGLELEYPIFDTKVKYLIEENIIKAPTPIGKQLFRIYREVRNMSSIICYARHIFYDLLDNFIESYRTGNVTGNRVLQGILGNTQYPNNFKGYSDILTIADAYYVRKNPIVAIMGKEKNSFLSRWGGEILRDNFNISILNSIGKDNGVTIAYAKNLLGIEEDLDMSGVFTRIMPTGLTENDQSILLPEKYIDSPNIDKYPFPKITHIHFGDIKVDLEKNVTLNNVQNLLREKVQELYSVNKIDIPKVNYKVDFVELSKTEEYKNYRILEKINLGDMVTVKHKKLNIDIKAKVIKYVWDCLLGKYLNIELGNFKENLSKDLNNISSSIEDVKEDMNENNKKIKSRIEQQDDKITLAVEEVNKTKASIEITIDQITSKVENMETNTSSVIDQKTDSITLTVKDELNKMSSKIQQQANNISLVVDGGSINAASIAMAITENKSAINMIADTIEIKPKDGVIHFSNGTDIDTRDSTGQNNPNHIRLRADWNSYVLVDTVGTHVYRSLDGSTTKAVWTFNENGAYFKGKKVKLQFE
ncbi:endopeptidase [Clostridium niameyense]|uniref:Endopeptidase n=1 Tax=Clostridium niameyense TaxID=1622073 RepID=A0A6M0R8D9_9CLOT|nr:phage tail spike protein [Clostridium niameyense]NEZ46494.1 endopeptidase [Clostridium niameyense]